jgi:hypothetical protein
MQQGHVSANRIKFGLPAPRASGASILDGGTTRILAGQRASGLLHNGKTDRSFDAVISPATAVMALK